VSNNKKVNIFLLIIAVVLFIFLPRFLSGYWVRVITTIFMYAVIAQGMNIMSGYMGYLPFGNAMFFGIGAYITAIGMSKGLPFLVVAPLAAITAILFSILLGLPVLRLRGHYFAIATIGMSAAILSVVQNATEITGGAMGTTLPIIRVLKSRKINIMKCLMSSMNFRDGIKRLGCKPEQVWKNLD